MATFTGVTDISNHIWVHQHEAADAVSALRAHVGSLDEELLGCLSESELDYLIRVADGVEAVELIPVGRCRGVWLWVGGTQLSEKLITYLIKTDARA